MKHLVFVLFFQVQLVAFSQVDSTNWVFAVEVGLEKHDKRLFNYNEKNQLLSTQPESWGTYKLNILLSKQLLNVRQLSLFVFSGIGYERATFLRPFDHFYFQQDFNEILRHQNIYEKYELPYGVKSFINVSSKLFFNIGLNSSILCYRRINHSEKGLQGFPYTASSFELSDFNMSSGLNFKSGNFILGMDCRLFNFEKIDKVIFNTLIEDPRKGKTWESYNPLRLTLSMAYCL